nr:MAG TPA: hypothetical protein [Caudoviricetes sp.]
MNIVLLLCVACVCVLRPPQTCSPMLQNKKQDFSCDLYFSFLYAI